MQTYFLNHLLAMPDYQWDTWFFMAVFFIAVIAFAFIKLFTYAAKRWKEGTEAGERPEQPYDGKGH